MCIEDVVMLCSLLVETETNADYIYYSQYNVTIKYNVLLNLMLLVQFLKVYARLHGTFI